MPRQCGTNNLNSSVRSGSPKIGAKRKKLERTSRELKSSPRISKPVLELEDLDHYKTECIELSAELEKKKLDLEKKELELEKMEFEIGKKELELEKKNVECTEYWRNKCSDLESLVLRLELENSTMRCEASRNSNLESLVLRNGNQSSILRREEELYNSENIVSDVRVSLDEITQSGENPRDGYNMSKLNAETSIGGIKESRVYELKTKEKVLVLESGFHKCSVVSIPSGSVHLLSGGDNVEQGEDLGCLEERPSQHGPSSQAHDVEMNKKTFGNLVSDSDEGSDSLVEPEDSTGFVDLQICLGDPVDTLAMKNSERNQDEMEWKSEPELLSSFEEDPELCIKAVCALNRQEISEEEISAGLYYRSDILRWTTLAKLIMGEDCKGDVMKSLKETETLDPTAVADCKKLARRYSIHLFDIYQNGKDPFFHPAKTASHGDHC